MMVNNCCDPKCDSGGKESNFVGSFFGFPCAQTQNHLREKWIKTFPVSNWTPIASARLCERHFSPDEITTKRRDSNKLRKEAGGTLKRNLFKRDVVPMAYT